MKLVLVLTHEYRMSKALGEILVRKQKGQDEQKYIKVFI